MRFILKIDMTTTAFGHTPRERRNELRRILESVRADVQMRRATIGNVDDADGRSVGYWEIAE